MRWFALFLMLTAAESCGEASIVHWTTRLLHMNCDNHPVSRQHDSLQTPQLMPRVETSDLLTPTFFEARRQLADGSTLTLGVCNGEIHVLPALKSTTLKVTVRLAVPLGHERTPKDYLQEFSLDATHADIEWKLPQKVSPVIYVYVPKNTRLNLQLGNVQLEIKGVRGDKDINAGKGTARLDVADDGSEYSRIIVDVAMGSFVDLRPGGTQSHHVPLHEELSGNGTHIAHVRMGMGKAEIAAE